MKLEGGESISGEQLPTFAESEYVTEVGQYLMTGMTGIGNWVDQ